MLYRSVLLTVLTLVAVSHPAVSTAQQPTNRDQSGTTDLREEGYPIRAEIPVVTADDAGLRDDDLVLGVVVGGEARAYRAVPSGARCRVRGR